jgi:hypothetical protein
MPEALTMTGRGLRLTMRKPDALVTALMLYVTYVVPGVLVLCAITGSSGTAVTVCQT